MPNSTFSILQILTTRRYLKEEDDPPRGPGGRGQLIFEDTGMMMKQGWVIEEKMFLNGWVFGEKMCLNKWDFQKQMFLKVFDKLQIILRDQSITT